MCRTKFAPRWSMVRPVSSDICAGKCSKPFPLRFSSSKPFICPKSVGKLFIWLCLATSTLRCCSLHISGGNSLRLFWDTSILKSWPKFPISGGSGDSWLLERSRCVVSSRSSISRRSSGSRLSPFPLREKSRGSEGPDVWYEDTWKLMFTTLLNKKAILSLLIAYCCLLISDSFTFSDSSSNSPGEQMPARLSPAGIKNICSTTDQEYCQYLYTQQKYFYSKLCNGNRFIIYFLPMATCIMHAWAPPPNFWHTGTAHPSAKAGRPEIRTQTSPAPT